MQFEYGSARFVICIGPWAIKIARIKIIYWIVRIFHRVRRGNLGEIIEKKVGVEKARFARTKLLFLGIYSNFEEMSFYDEHPELPLAPTLLSILGLVNIQKRARPATEKELALCPLYNLHNLHIDFRKPEHYGWIDNKVCLVDYGNPEVNKIVRVRVIATQTGLAFTF